MDMTPTAHTTSNTTSTKSPEPESETPTRVLAVKPVSFTNGVLKRLAPAPLNHHPPAAVAVTYRECQKNHAATMGGHALDGCGEFMPSPDATASDPTSIKCAACGCHRNFHRREPEDAPPTPIAATHIIEYQSQHRHHPPPPPPPHSPSSASPPPISSSYYPHPHAAAAAPHVLLALSTAAVPENSHLLSAAMISPPGSRKRFRTKFSQTQKDRMFEFAERIGWKIQKKDEEIIRDFCSEIGVERGVLKVWMHNNKNTLGKKLPSSEDAPTNNNHHHSMTDNGSNPDSYPTSSGGGGGASDIRLVKTELNGGGGGGGGSHGGHHNHHHLHLHHDHNPHHVGTNGSSSSS